MSRPRLPWSRNRRMWWLIACATVLIPIVTLAAALVPSRKPAPGPAPSTPVQVAAGPRAVPLRIGPNFTAPGQLDRPRIAKTAARLEIGKPTTLSMLLHALRLFGPGATVPAREPGRRASLVAIALDQRAGTDYFGGQPALIDTREGVRCRVVQPLYAKEQPERQAHPGQLLAVLAEVGISLDQPVSTSGGPRSVRRILDDTLAHFDPKQNEIEWTALALALYLPPRRSWANKFGETFTLDALAGELMSRPFESSIACGGTHLLYSLVTLLRADQQESVLADPVRREVRDRLHGVVESLVRTQLSDGSWDHRWREHGRGAGADPHDGDLDHGGEAERVLLTGHHLEWLVLLPPDLQPPPDRFLRAARWLLERVLNDPTSTLDEGYCPYSHAGRVLLTIDGSTPLLSGRGEGNRRDVSIR
jgi:hypothetical protein